MADTTKPIRTENVEIHIKNQENGEIFTREITEFGPIIPINGPWGLERILPEGHAAALSWTALTEDDHSITAGLDMMRASNVNAAISTLQKLTAPAQLFSFADSDGNIAQIVAGAIPKRAQDNQSQGRIPAASWLNSAAGFTEIFAYRENPRIINPEDGLLLHTNNKITDAPYPNHFSFEWGDTYRIIRAQNLLGSRKFHTASSFAEAQNDDVSEAARVNTALIASSFWFQPDDNGQKTYVSRMLAEWNGEFDALRPEPLIYSAWIEELNNLLFSDELGPLLDELGRTDPLRIERVYRNIDGAAHWCDIRPTTALETCPEIAEWALDRTLEKLSKQYGSDVDTWRWGKAHQAFHKNQVLGEIPIFGSLTHIRQEQSGSSETLLRGAYKGGLDYNFTAYHGAALRMVVDFSDLEHSKIIISTGQSGHILSPHYDDLSVMWRIGEYLNMTTRRDVIEGNLQGKITFTPNTNTAN